MTTVSRWIAACSLACVVPFAQALEILPYTSAALAAAQKAGKPVALHFHANWCPACLAQDLALAQLKSEPGLDITVLTVDYDRERDLRRQFHVLAQSTLIAMHGDRETAWLVADASVARIRAVLKSAL